MVGDMNFSNPDNLRNIGQIKAPICAVDNYMDSDFAEAYKKKYGLNADSFSLWGYIISSLMKQALDNMGDKYTTDDIYKYIRTHTFETVGGAVSFDPKTAEPNIQLIFKETYPNE